MKLSVFDLHCDTAYEMLQKKQPLTKNSLAVSLEHAKDFEQYVQVMALWTDASLSDEDGWKQALAMRENLLRDEALQAHTAELCTSCPPVAKGRHLLLAVEDARILAGKEERVDELYRLGVRILTLLWKGDTCIGGSHDTTHGLTAFGKAALYRALRLGMLPDISHASVASAEDTFAIAEELHRPVIASHSNAYTVCPVSRNLRDEQIKRIIQSDGVIGINLFPAFLREGTNITSDALFPHIDHFLSMGASEHLCIGGDLDGAPLPKDLHDLSSYHLLAETMLAHGYSEALVQKLFFGNAHRFASTHLL